MKPRGLLTVVGSLDIAQFWPASKGTSSSDGDTVHLKVNPASSFVFSSFPSAPPKATQAFLGGTVKDHGQTKKVITSKREIKVRLQGIDAPELHFPVIGTWDPSKKGKFSNEFRQPYGAGAANALHDYLTGFLEAGAATIIRAMFVTRIDHPGDAIDSHGRFVGDIVVGTGAGTSINTWLVENGWAYPLLYDSMIDTEVQTIIKAWKVGKTIGSRPGKAFQKALQPFDPTMNVGNATLPDKGKPSFPKIFRRQAAFWSTVPGRLTPEEFVEHLSDGLPGKRDTAYLTSYFLKNIDKLDQKKRIELVSKIGSKGESNFEPDGLVFTEDPSTLLGANGKKVTSW